MRTFIFLLGTIAAFSSHAQMVTQIQSFSPTGLIGTVEQVHVQFSDFMFPVGENDHASPMNSACDQYGKGRWLNPKEWVFDFKTVPPPTTRCEYALKSGLKSQKGIPVVADTESYFFDISPATLGSTLPRGETDIARLDKMAKYNGVDPDQVFVLAFNRDISNAEVAKRISFVIEGRSEPVGIEVLDRHLGEKINKAEHAYLSYGLKSTLVAVKPKLELPNTEFSLITLRDGNDKKLYYRVRPYFKAEFTCNRDNADAPCSPIQRVELTFNSLVASSDLEKIKAVPLHKKGPVLTVKDQDLSHASHAESVFFKGPFQAGETYKIEIPKNLKDIRERDLKNQNSFPLTVQFDSLPSVAKFPGNFGVIESENPVLPLSVRNIEKELEIKESNLSDLKSPEHAPDILRWMRRVEFQSHRTYPGYDIRAHQADAKAADYESIFGHFADRIHDKVTHTSLPTDHLFNQAEVVGIPLKEKGFHIVELESKVLGKNLFSRPLPLYTSTAILLTNLGVHFKWAQNGPSLVWVTELSTGKPVEGANITIESCTGREIAKGKTGPDGTLVVEEIGSKKLAPLFSKCTYQTTGETKLVVMAKKDDDFSFTLNNFNRGLETWRFNLPYSYGKNIAAHTVLARDLLKPGQTVQMKHYYREFHWQGFTVPAKTPTVLRIEHNGSGEKWTMPVKFNAQGIATSEWQIPETAKLGYYSIVLAKEQPKEKTKPNYRDNGDVQVGGFEVQEFRLPVLNVALKVPDPITQDLKDPKISIQGTYLSGGPSSELPVELRFLREKTERHTRIVGDYVYSLDEAVTEGVSEKKNRYHYADDEDDENAPQPVKETLENTKWVKKVNLDKSGSAYVEFPSEVTNTNSEGDVRMSLSYTDPNGEVQSAMRLISVFSRDRYLGIHKENKSYYEQIKDIKMNLRLADLKGKAVPDVGVQVDLYRSTDYTHRAKLVGGFYGYQTTTEIKKLKTVCDTKTNSEGSIACVFDVPEAGNYIAEVKSLDSKGKKLVLTHEFSAYGHDSEDAEYSESDRLTLVPSKEEYNANEDAVINVRSSFKNSTALVTLEREGVMEHFVTQISSDKPEIKIPMKMEYSPNLVLSVFEVRGRLADPAPTGLLDLAKPAFKLGMLPLRVGIKSHELPITIHTDKTIYPIRSRVKVSVETKPGAELALAVVDEALLKLKPNETFDLLKSMMISQGHGVETSSMQMNLIGKRHFGKKATPFGGGGGKMMTRELLDSLISWQPNLVADANGKIETDFKLNDSISSFELVAVGSEGLNFYGKAKTQIAATQDLQILSSLPINLRESDQLPLQFLLRNTTLKPLHVTARLKIDGHDRSPIEIDIPSQGAQEVKWNETIPFGEKTLPLLISATSKEGPSDQLKLSIPIVEVTPVTVREGFLTQLGSTPSTLPMSFPADALTTKGGYRVQAQARLSDLPESMFRYFANYPYSCLEQQTSKAIGRGDLKEWLGVQQKFKTYLDSNSLLKYFPDMRYGSLDLTAYILEIADAASQTDKHFAIPKSPLKDRLIDALRRGMRGEIQISETWWPDYVKNDERIYAGEALSSYETIPQASYESLKSVRDKTSLSQSLSLLRILDQSSSTLTQSLSDREIYLQEILSHYTYENTHLTLRGAGFRFFGNLSDSPDGLRARTLIAFITHDKKDEATKLLRSLVEGMKAGAYDTTPGNTWASVALNRFRQKYENEKVSGSLSVKVGEVQKKMSISEIKPKAETFVPIHEALNDKKSTDLIQTFHGSGKPWSFTLVEAAIPSRGPVDHGYTITKEIKPLQSTKEGVMSHGDVYEVKLTIDARNHQTWLVLIDPLPTGASILSSESNGGMIAFEEHRADRLQLYYQYLSTGRATFTYKVRLNQQGIFEFPATRLEAMYDPTQYGEVPNIQMKVAP